MAEQRTKDYEAGDVIFREGDEGDLMYILVEGAVELRKKVEGGEAVLKTVTTPNEFFGEMAIIDGGLRSATAIAAAPSTVIPVDDTVFESLVLSNPRFALTVIRALSARIRSSNVQISDLIETIPRERLARGMADYASRNGEKIFDGGWKVDLADMREWINSHVGTTVDEIDSFLGRLIKAGSARRAATSSKEKEQVILGEVFVRDHNRRS